jgi:amino-acid N-acetyltransferase
MDMMPTVATPDELPQVTRLVAASHLPLDGLLDQAGRILVIKDGGQIVGCVALEVHADGALLRSLAVDDSHRGKGLGRRLIASALEVAGSLGVPAVYLLTTTAESYFPRFGFATVSRDVVPAAVRTSIEFRSACPSTATAMRMAFVPASVTAAARVD